VTGEKYGVLHSAMSHKYDPTALLWRGADGVWRERFGRETAEGLLMGLSQWANDAAWPAPWALQVRGS